MWLGRLFGGRKGEGEDEPARFAPPESAPPKSTRSRPPVKSTQGGIDGAKAGSTPVKQVKSGFDPYNSGAFERGQAWERITRR